MSEQTKWDINPQIITNHSQYSNESLTLITVQDLIMICVNHKTFIKYDSRNVVQEYCSKRKTLEFLRNVSTLKLKEGLHVPKSSSASCEFGFSIGTS